MANDHPQVGGSAAWRVLPIAGLIVWIGAVIAVGARSATPQDGEAVTTAFVLGGSIYFSLLFAGAALSMRRAQRRARHDLFDRLVVLPVEPGELRRATRPLYTIGYVYVAFGAIVTACGLTAVALGADAERPVLNAMVAIVAAWAVFASYAIARAWGSAGTVMRPLGLELTEIPQHHVSLFTDRTWMTGATSYEGIRHGRAVSITQTTKAAATVVGGATGDGPVPRTPIEMAALTGEPARQWRRVEVRREGDTVVVTRRASGAGAWFLHDLLLAEAVAGTVAGTRT